MKNQLCRPCDYRRAFRYCLRVIFVKPPDYVPPYAGRCTSVEFSICWRYVCPLMPEQVGYFNIAPMLAMLKRAAIKAYGDFYWNNLFANLNGCGPLMANSSKLWESPNK